MQEPVPVNVSEVIETGATSMSTVLNALNVRTSITEALAGATFNDSAVPDT